MPCAISSYEGAEVNISTYFEPSDDNRPFYPFVIYSRTTQRALSRLKVCTHWATNRLPATLLVGRCVSRSGSGTCHQRSDGCCVILRPRDLQVCLGSLSQPDNKLCLLRLNLSFQDKNTRMTCLLRPSDVSQSEAAAKVGWRWRQGVKSHLKDQIIHLFLMQGFLPFLCWALVASGAKRHYITAQLYVGFNEGWALEVQPPGLTIGHQKQWLQLSPLPIFGT